MLETVFLRSNRLITDETHMKLLKSVVSNWIQAVNQKWYLIYSSSLLRSRLSDVLKNFFSVSDRFIIDEVNILDNKFGVYISISVVKPKWYLIYLFNLPRSTISECIRNFFSWNGGLIISGIQLTDYRLDVLRSILAMISE